MRMLTPYFTTRSLASDFFDEMDRFFEGTPANFSPRNFYDERTFHPACEVSESEDHYMMSVDLPGMKKEDIKIELNNNVLTISGERKREATPERSYGFFKRGFTLSNSIESGRVEARYENGVLELYLPKTQAAKSRQIEIQSGKTGIFDKLLGSKKTSQNPDTQSD